ETTMAAQRLEAGLHRAVSLYHHLHAQPDPGAVVGREATLGVGDRDPAPALRIARLHLGHLGAGGPRGLVAGAPKPRLAPTGDIGRRNADLLEAGRVERVQCLCLPALTARGVGDRRRGPLEVPLPQAVDVREIARLAGDHADSRAALGAAL